MGDIWGSGDPMSFLEKGLYVVFTVVAKKCVLGDFNGRNKFLKMAKYE